MFLNLRFALSPPDKSFLLALLLPFLASWIILQMVSCIYICVAVCPIPIMSYYLLKTAVQNKVDSISPSYSRWQTRIGNMQPRIHVFLYSGRKQEYTFRLVCKQEYAFR